MNINQGIRFVIGMVSLGGVSQLVSCIPEHPSIGNTPYNYIIDGPQDLYPAFSPDGNSIAYTHESDTAKSYPPGLYVIDRNGGNRKLILLGPHLTPAWSSDGKWLIFSTGGTLQKCKLNGDSLTTFTGLDPVGLSTILLSQIIT